MRGSSPTRLEGLTPEHWQRLDALRESWTRLRLGVFEADRQAASEGVRRAYVAAGLAAPQEIVWCEGPRELARKWGRARERSSAGANVRFALIDEARERADRMRRACVGQQDWLTILRAASTPATDGVSAMIVDAVARRTFDTELPLASRLRLALSRLMRLASPRDAARTIAWSGISSYELGWLAALDFVCEACGREDEREAIMALGLVAAHASWIIPYERVCWLARRHSVLALDARGRLHSAAGPALAFPDGWSLHAWKGCEVPAAAIEHPEAITVAAIDLEPDAIVRRSLIEILTPRRYIDLGGARAVRRDETGVLWRKTWRAGDAWAAVEVVDGTPRPDGTERRYVLQVPPDMPSARAAVAWTYGMSERQYARLAIRT